MNVNKRRIYMCSALITLSLFGLVFFQNCAPPKPGSDEYSQSSVADVGTNTNTVKIDGKCGDSLNTCGSGRPLNMPDTFDKSLWKCAGSGGGVSITCASDYLNTPVEGFCGKQVNRCDQGQFEDVQDSSGEAFWNCKGFNGGVVKNCRLPLASIVTGPIENGRCGDNVGQCSAGIFEDLNDDENFFKWRCKGRSGGADQDCSIARSCGAAINTCASGVFAEVPDDSINFLWKCVGNNNRIEVCKFAKPYCKFVTQPVTHIGEKYTYNIETINNVRLPEHVKVQIFGSRGELNSSVMTKDFDGTEDKGLFVDVTTPFSYTPQENHSGGKDAGRFSRYAVVSDIASGIELCKTPPITHLLTPACGLSANKEIVSRLDTMTLTFDFLEESYLEIGLAATPSSVTWYGKKDGAAMPNRNPESVSRQKTLDFKLAQNGHYERYFIAKDAGGNELCKSNVISYDVVDAAPLDAICNEEAKNCTAGDYVDLGDSSTQYVWSCNGLYGGTSKTCTQNKATPTTNAGTNTVTNTVNNFPPINGICGNTGSTGSTGAYSLCQTAAAATNITSIQGQGTFTTTWVCPGVNGGADVTCQGPVYAGTFGPFGYGGNVNLYTNGGGSYNNGLTNTDLINTNEPPVIVPMGWK